MKHVICNVGANISEDRAAGLKIEKLSFTTLW